MSSPSIEKIRQTLSLQQTLGTRQSNRKYRWNTWGIFRGNVLDPDHTINNFRHYVKIGVTTAEQEAGLDRLSIHPDDSRQAFECAITIGDLATSLVNAVNERYAASQDTKEIREANRARTLQAFLDDCNELNVIDTVGEFVKKMDIMAASTKTRLEEVKSITPATICSKETSPTSNWTSNYWVS
jgi:hypothetical protein